MIRSVLTALMMALAAPALAADPVEATLRPGWRLANGDHMAALHLRLAPGWKTYWRAPGDAGIPPVFDWRGSSNMAEISLLWPTPHVFWQSGMRSIGYKRELVLPIRIKPQGAGDIQLQAQVQLGLCEDICMPHELAIKATLSQSVTKPDPVIASAMASVPFSEKEAAVKGVKCEVSPIDGGMALRAEIAMPRLGGKEEAVVESGQPSVWTAEPQVTRTNGTLIAETKLMHVEGRPFALDRSRLRFTVLGKGQAVDIQGCD